MVEIVVMLSIHVKLYFELFSTYYEKTKMNRITKDTLSCSKTHVTKEVL